MNQHVNKEIYDRQTIKLKDLEKTYNVQTAKIKYLEKKLYSKKEYDEIQKIDMNYKPTHGIKDENLVKTAAKPNTQ